VTISALSGGVVGQRSMGGTVRRARPEQQRRKHDLTVSRASNSRLQICLPGGPAQTPLPDAHARVRVVRVAKAVLHSCLRRCDVSTSRRVYFLQHLASSVVGLIKPVRFLNGEHVRAGRPTDPRQPSCDDISSKRSNRGQFALEELQHQPRTLVPVRQGLGPLISGAATARGTHALDEEKRSAR
jgi:hypothetical protein